MSEAQLRDYLNRLQTWLSSQREGTVVRGTIRPYQEFLSRVYNWLSGLTIDPQVKRSWMNYVAGIQQLAESRRCKGVELLDVCQEPGTPSPF